MNPMRGILFSLFAVCVLYKAAEAESETSSIYLSGEVSQDISYAISDLAQDLSVQLTNDGSKSDILSPLSIGSSLLLLLRIARGKTRVELLKLLHLEQYHRNDPKIPSNFKSLITELLDGAQFNAAMSNGPAWWGENKCIDSEYEDEYEDSFELESKNDGKTNIVQLANAIFVQNGMFNNSILEDRVKTLYSSIIENVDFEGEPEEVTDHINKWANESTKGRIPQIISSRLSRDTTMVLANALYFKAFWEDVFLEGATKPRKFFPNGENEDPVEVDVMAHSGCFPYYTSESLDARILGFPYKNRTSTMYIILPNNSNRIKLQQLLKELDGRTLNQLISNMTMRTASVLFPKMHITSSFDLKSALKGMGVSAMFRRGSNDFSTLNKAFEQVTRGLRVSGIMHKVDLEVNEAGTEGGAVTITLQDRIGSSVNFRVLTPFLLAIRHDSTKLLLFYGPVYDPS